MEANDLANSLIDDMAKNMPSVESGIEGINSAASDLNDTLAAASAASGLDDVSKETDTATKSISDFVKKLKSIAGAGIDKAIHPIQTIKTALGSARDAAGKFVTKLKDIGKLDIANIKKLANISLNKLASGVEAVGKALKNIASKAATAAAEIGKISLKGLAVAGTAAAVGIGAAVTQAVTQYADCEQLIGGVETLFKDSAGTVQQYAREAFQTTGLSANDYMETVTGFSASMIQSLGGDTAKAAELSNQALIDMSDNANKMGTDMGSIQYAYQGFAKQNYTMLDNLKLGYGGTQEEMQRLLSDAEKLTGQKYDISSFADVTEAIHAIQTEMGITGTTAKEASTTISGSLNSMKAAWQNVLVDLVNGGDNLDNSINALVQSAMTFGDNIIPAVEKALSGLNTMIAELAPVIADVFAQLVSTLLPSLINSVVTLLQTLITSIAANGPQITQGLISAVMMAIEGLVTLIPMMLDAATQLIMGLIQGLTAAAPQLINSAVMMLQTLVNGIVSNLPMLLSAALNLVMSLANGIISNLPTIIQTAVSLVVGLIQGLMSMLPQVIQMGIQLVVQLAVGLVQAIPQLIAAIPQIVSAIWDGITSVNWLDLGVQIVKGIWDGIKSLAGSVWEGIKLLFTGGSDTGEIDAAAANAGTSYTTALNSSINSTAIDTTALSSGLSLDLTTQGTQSATSWSNSFSTTLNGEGIGLTAVTSALNTNLNMDLTMQGSQSASTWNSGFNSGLIGGGSTLTTTIEQIKTTMVMDLTMQGTQSAASWGTGFTTGITNAAGTVTAAMEMIRAALGLDFASLAAASCSSVIASFSSMSSTITELTSSAAKTILSTVRTTGAAVVVSITSTMNRLVSVITSGMNKAVSAVKSAASSIKSSLQNLNLYSIGSNMMQGLVNGINAKKSAAVEAARSIANAVNDEFRQMEDINSPSKVWHKYGSYLVEGLSVGVTDTIPKAENSISSLAGAYTPETDKSITTTNNSTVSENNTYSPQFNLTINGSNGDRAMERKVKRWIMEALTEADEAMKRKQKVVQVF